MKGHIYAPAPVEYKIARRACPTCEKRRYFLDVYYEWLGGEITCLFCGERFTEEGRLPRPFCRGWREMNKERARKRYRRFKQKEA